MGLAAVAIAAGVAQAGDAEFPYTINTFFTGPNYTGCTGEPLVMDANLSCDALQTSAVDMPGAPIFLWLIVGGVPDGIGGGAPGGIGGIQFGMSHDLSSPPSWTLCTGGAQIPQDDPVGGMQWPSTPVSGNAITWGGGCYLVQENEDGMTKIGWLTINPGATGVVTLTGDPRIDGVALAADCAATESRICAQSLGRGDASVDGTEGLNTCGFLCAVPVAETSWGSLKSLYNNR
jgi:hypothetical protein